MTLNRQWHEANKLPRNASLEDRLNWHMQHAENCGCRPMPDAISRELDARGWTAPSVRSRK